MNDKEFTFLLIFLFIFLFRIFYCIIFQWLDRKRKELNELVVKLVEFSLKFLLLFFSLIFWFSCKSRNISTSSFIGNAEDNRSRRKTRLQINFRPKSRSAIKTDQERDGKLWISTGSERKEKGSEEGGYGLSKVLRITFRG